MIVPTNSLSVVIAPTNGPQCDVGSIMNAVWVTRPWDFLEEPGRERLTAGEVLLNVRKGEQDAAVSSLKGADPGTYPSSATAARCDNQTHWLRPWPATALRAQWRHGLSTVAGDSRLGGEMNSWLPKRSVEAGA